MDTKVKLAFCLISCLSISISIAVDHTTTKMTLNVNTESHHFSPMPTALHTLAHNGTPKLTAQHSKTPQTPKATVPPTSAPHKTTNHNIPTSTAHQVHNNTSPTSSNEVDELKKQVDYLQKVVGGMARHMMLQQLFVEERIRSDGDSGLKQIRYKKNPSLILNAPIATKVVCFSRLLKCLRSLYGKQCGSRKDCSCSLFWVHAVCFFT